MLVKIAFTLIILGLPAICIGKIWGDPSPFKMNGADCIGITGFYGAIVGVALLIIESLICMWAS